MQVNPIDFENSEGNAGIATAMLRFMADKLPVSRLQRDLSDSTVLRSLGAALGHSALAWDSCARGLTKLQPCVPVMAAELDAHWEVLAEAVQTVMRRHGLPAPYEQLKALTRGHSVNRESLHGNALAVTVFTHTCNLIGHVPIPTHSQALPSTPVSYRVPLIPRPLSCRPHHVSLHRFALCTAIGGAGAVKAADTSALHGTGRAACATAGAPTSLGYSSRFLIIN